MHTLLMIRSDPSGNDQEQPGFCDIYPDNRLCNTIYTCPDGSVTVRDGGCPDQTTPAQQAKRRPPPPKPYKTTPVQWFDPTTLNNWTDALNMALKDLAKPECAKHFDTSGTGANPVDALNVAAGASDNGALLFFGTTGSQAVSAISDYQGDYLWWQHTSYSYAGLSTRGVIEINVAAWNASSLVWDAGTLIHELGHLYDMVQGLGGSDFVYDADPNGNPIKSAEDQNAAILQDCLN